MRDSFAASTDAHAFAIGAVLIIIIVASVTTLYLSINAPIETKKCEFQHFNEVTEDFTMLNSTMHSLFRAESSVASVSVPIKMTPTKESRIALPLSSGSITFSPTEENVIVGFDEDGTPVPGPWTDDYFSNTTTNNVDTSSGNATLTAPYSSGYIESNMTDSSGHIGFDTGSNSTIYKNISWHTKIPPNTKIVIKVRTDMFPNMAHAKDWARCPEIKSKEGFNKISLSDLSSVSNGHRYVQYRAELKTWDPSETPTLINVSINYSSPSGGVVLAQSSGSISFASNYHYLPNHVLTYENGAVIKSQEEGEFVFRPFNISFNTTSGVPRINISLVNLTGNNVTHSGAPAASVRLLRSDHKLISDSFFYPNLMIIIYSKYPYACEKWFNKKLEESELDDSYYDLNVSDGTMTVEFGDGVQLYLEKTAVEVKI